MNDGTEKKQVSAVIPAYNEAAAIGRVLETLRQTDGLHEILVVNDGSADETAAIVQQHRAADGRISLLSLPYNQGKGRAIFAGAAAARGELLLFLDADLKGLRPDHIHRLISPVRQGECVLAVGLFEDGRWQTNITHHIFPFLSGQRCLRRPYFQNLYQDSINGWSIETALSLHAAANHYPVKYVMWPGVTHAIRTEKRGSLAGLWSHLRMWWEIGQYTGRFLTHHLRLSWENGRQTLPSSEPTGLK